MTDQDSLDVLTSGSPGCASGPCRPPTRRWLAARTGPVTSAGLAAARPAIWDFELPVMVLHESALAHNIEAMAAYCAAQARTINSRYFKLVTRCGEGYGTLGSLEIEESDPPAHQTRDRASFAAR